MEEIQMTFREKLAVAETYALRVDTEIEIDTQKEIVRAVDHATKEWSPIEKIYDKYFEKAGED